MMSLDPPNPVRGQANNHQFEVDQFEVGRAVFVRAAESRQRRLVHVALATFLNGSSRR